VIALKNLWIYCLIKYKLKTHALLFLAYRLLVKEGESLLNKIVLLENKIKEYAWGSKTFIPDLMGIPSPQERPLAEMWLGAHPNASSLALMGNMQIPLNELINRDPEGTLGVSVANRFSNSLPFLLKVLAAAKPLSIQAHPNKEQAKEGFARENLKKIPLDSLNRNFKDQNHKPELICALTPLYALKGFRRNRDIIDLMDRVGAQACGLKSDLLWMQPEKGGLKGFFKSLLTMNKKRQNLVIEKIIGKVNDMETSEPAFQWMKRLHNEYPGDIGVFSPLFLNVVSLKPTEAMYIDSGELHAYLEGSGLEIMANSDNVIRGGLTPKHVDINGLIDMLEFVPHEPQIILPEEIGNNEAVYPTGSDEFILSVVSLKGGGSESQSYHGPAQRSAEIILCTEGNARIEDIHKGEKLEVSKGSSLFIPASVEGYTITGVATFYKAAMPL
jgi:mannose-6-phosphate isomerase